MILIYHQSIAGKGHWYIARWLLVSLLVLQTARLIKLSVTRRSKLSPAPVKAEEASR
jgi:hypothetical protein